jgi:hypothetical protein
MGKAMAVFHGRTFAEKVRALYSLIPHLTSIRKGSKLLNFVRSSPRLFRK